MPLRFNLPPLTRALLLINLTLSAVNVAIRFRKWSTAADASSALTAVATPSNYFTAPALAVPFLVLVPVKSLKFPWTFLTAALVENNLVSLAVSVMVMWYGARYLERAWGSTEFTKFLLFTITIPNVVAFCIYAVWHCLAGTPEHPTPIQGLLAVESGFLVALKQLVPEHTVSLFKATVRIRVKHLPAVFILANMLSGPLLGTDTAFWLSLAGFVVSWVYLRFIRTTEIVGATATGESSKMKGDSSDTFAFVAFFPDVLHPILAPICDGIYNGLVRLKICVPFSEAAIEAGNENAASRSEGGLPNIMNQRGGGRRAEAERRRALALKALDQRLAATSNRAASAPGTTAAEDLSSSTSETAVGASDVGIAENGARD